MQVQNLDDFISRYNGYHDANGQDVDQSSLLFKEIHGNKYFWQEYRKNIIGSLVNNSIIEADSSVVLDFARIASRGPELNYYSDNWYCRIPFEGSFKNKVVSGTLILKIWYDDQHRTKWYIQECIFDQILNIKTEIIEPEECSHIYITPTAHENNFIDLRRVLSGQEVIENHIMTSSEGLAQLKHLIEKEMFQPMFSSYYFHFSPKNGLTFTVDNRYSIISIQ